jgi:hypothetical protein
MYTIGETMKLREFIEELQKLSDNEGLCDKEVLADITGYGAHLSDIISVSWKPNIYGNNKGFVSIKLGDWRNYEKS